MSERKEIKVFPIPEEIFAVMTETMAWAPKNIADPAFMMLKEYLDQLEQPQIIKE